MVHSGIGQAGKGYSNKSEAVYSLYIWIYGRNAQHEQYFITFASETLMVRANPHFTLNNSLKGGKIDDKIVQTPLSRAKSETL